MTTVHGRDVRTVLPFLVGMGLFALLAAFNQARGFELWRNYALSGILLGAYPTYLFWRYDVRIPSYIQWTIVGALMTHYGGGSLGSPEPYKMGLWGMHGINGAYHHFSWWDHLTHGVGIGASAMGIAYLFEVYHVRRGLRWTGAAVFLTTLAAALTAGVGVELYEYLGKTMFQTIDQGGYENTMQDLHFNLLGAAAGAGLAVTVNRRRFWSRIQDRWRVPRTPRAHAAWWRRVTAPMVGFVTFCGITAGGALFLAVRYLTQDVPADDLHLYDPALQTMTWLTLLGLALAPVAALLHTRNVRAALVPAPEEA